MAGDITLALRNAQSGLLVNQAALDAVSQNIANSNSEGYSRKIIRLEQRVVAGTGAGVQIAEVQRSVDEQLLKSVRLETSSLNQLDSKGEYFSRTQQIFGTPGDNTSIAHMIGEFAASLEVLAGAPDQTQNHSEVIRQAELLEDKFVSMSKDIQELRVQAEQEITTAVGEINSIITEISSLNDTIVRQDAVGNDISDLLDRRDIQLTELAEYLDITYFYRGDNQVIVYTQSGRTLVDEISSTLLHTQTFATSALHAHDSGDINGIYVGAETGANDITNELIDGKLKGLVDMRDDILPDLQAQLDELAADMGDVFNQNHNRGISFPGYSSYTGTRNFVDSATSTITYSGNGDTRVVVTDVNGNQQATTTIRTLLGGAGPATIDATATALQTWLTGTAGVTGATVAVNSDGRFAIELNSTTYYLGFRDETATTAGSTHSDATIQYNVNADGTVDETVSGFASFFGLNDLFIDNLPDTNWESNVMDTTYSTTNLTTIEFRDSTGAISPNITALIGSSLQDIADEVNAASWPANRGVTASVVNEGSGQRLRFSYDAGSSMSVYATAGTVLSDIGMHVADTGAAASIKVRTDIAASPSLLARGALQWDANKGVAGEYYTSVNDETIANQLADAFSSKNSFETAGGLKNLNLTFNEYAASMIAYNADLADVNERTLTYQVSLTEDLQFKARTVSGVNLDEEMANLILFEQAYSAIARVVNTIKDMFDALEAAV